jgi:hypothetical protein
MKAPKSRPIALGCADHPVDASDFAVGSGIFSPIGQRRNSGPNVPGSSLVQKFGNLPNGARHE